MRCSHPSSCTYNIPWKYYNFQFSSGRSVRRLQCLALPYRRTIWSIWKIDNAINWLKIKFNINLTTYRHSPPTFWRVFLHIVAFAPGRCASSGATAQSVIESVLLSNGSAHFGSESLLHSQHLIAEPKKIFYLCFMLFSSSSWIKNVFFTHFNLLFCTNMIRTINGMDKRMQFLFSIVTEWLF